MARKKATNQTELLTRLVGVRLSENVYTRLEKFVESTDCQTVAELGRRLMSKERITYFHKDASMDATMEELSRIRKELNSIGTNINQITHSFHTADVANQRTFLALKVAEQYNKVGDKVEQLLKIVSQLAIKWLQK
jgi:methyl-accepting chemotaxis protein